MARSNVRCRRVDADTDAPDENFEGKRKEAFTQKIIAEEYVKLDTSARKAICQGLNVLMSIRDAGVSTIASRSKKYKRDDIFSIAQLTKTIEQPCKFVGVYTPPQQKKMSATEITALDFKTIIRLPVRPDNYEEILEATNVIGTKSGDLKVNINLRKSLDAALEADARASVIRARIVRLRKDVFADVISKIRDELWFVKWMNEKNLSLEAYLASRTGKFFEQYPTPSAYDAVKGVDPVISTSSEPFSVGPSEDWFIKFLETRGITQGVITSF